MRIKSRTDSDERRYDLDWLRVIAFAILIYFHAAVAFLPSGLPLTLNAESSETLAVIVAFFHNFRLALLFFVSGCGVHFALRRRGRKAFFLERSKRLLPPLLFGITVLVPFMVYLEKQYLGESFTSFAEFYSRYYINGTYPTGYLSWHHFWFLAYLYLMCLLAWPVLKWMRGARGSQKLSGWFDSLGKSDARIYLFFVPLLLVEIVLRPVFPGFRDLIHDWASFSHWMLIFLIGVWFAQDPRLIEAAKRLRLTSLIAAAIFVAMLFRWFWVPEQAHLYPFLDDQINVFRYVAFCALRILAAWFCILICLGYAARYLNRASTLLSVLNKSVYPVFCLHLPVLVALEYWVLPLGWSIELKFLVITTLAIIVLALMYSGLRYLARVLPWCGVVVGYRS